MARLAAVTLGLPKSIKALFFTTRKLCCPVT